MGGGGDDDDDDGDDRAVTYGVDIRFASTMLIGMVLWGKH